jgi:hypothetical protein
LELEEFKQNRRNKCVDAVRAVLESCTTMLAFDQTENLQQSYLAFVKKILEKPTLKLRPENLALQPVT